ncbi:hypothetical protein PybrP1_009529 [[Pythium] brassicae (nom. inval.)]|nr:hypothetical protein PybrP1_009529 [[Pythium] brassicae (nom. inval.)]
MSSAAQAAMASLASFSDSDSEGTSDTSGLRAAENEAHRSNTSPSAKAAATPRSSRGAEKRFRSRYRALQEAYESRLHALALQVQQAVAQLQGDSALFCLQENPLTSEFAALRVSEVLHESFFGEREKFIQVLSDQAAWQASDLRELRRQLRAVQRREKDALTQCAQAQREARGVQRQLRVRVDELEGQKRLAVQQEARLEALRGEKDALRLDRGRLAANVRAFEALEREHEALRAQAQAETERAQAALVKLAAAAQEAEALKAANVQLEMEKHTNEQEIAHVHHLLSLSEAKTRDASDALRLQQSKDYPSRLARLEAELAHTGATVAALQDENDELKSKYQEFGAQVDAFMREQADATAAAQKEADERVQRVQAEADAAREQAHDALKMKQSDVVRVVDQLRLRQEALAKAEQKIGALEERLRAAEAHVADEKLRGASQASKLEKEAAHWKNQVEKEKAKVVAGEKSFADANARYESVIARLRESFEKQLLLGAKEKEAEARARWQNDFAATQEARVEALKAKYDAALETQQAELLRARQQALDAAAAITAKYEAAKRSQRESDELERQRRLEVAAREQAARNEERARDSALQRRQSELDEREKRALEKERVLLEKERAEERRRADAGARRSASVATTAAAASSAPSTPSVVVLNMQTPDDTSHQEQQQQQTRSSRRAAVSVVNTTAVRRSEPSGESAFSSLDNVDSIPTAQHQAELQVREAQLMLESEEKLRAALQELQSRKEKEFRAAMVNVRKGIQKLEAAVDDARKEKASVELEVRSERQAFVALKQELDGAKEAKLAVVQRLEEANDNIGKLRRLVNECETKYRRADERATRAQEAEAKSALSVSASAAEIAALRSELAALETLGQQRETELNTARDEDERLRSQVRSLEDDLQRCREALHAETHAVADRATKEVSSAASRYESELKRLAASESATRSLLVTEEDTARRLASEVDELRRQRAAQDAALEQAKGVGSQQRTELSNLTRMHKNLVDTMERRVGEEVAERQRVEKLLRAAEKDVGDVRLHQQRVLLVYKMHLSKLQSDVVEMRKAAESEVKTSLRHLEREVLALSSRFEKQAALEHQAKIREHERQLASERAKSDARLQQKELELSGMFGSERVSEQAKFAQAVEQVEAKTRQVSDLETQLASEKTARAVLELARRKLESDAARHEAEQARLREQLSSSTVSSERASSETERQRVLLERRARIGVVLQGFVVSLVKAHELSAPGFLLREIDASRLEQWNEHQLTAELDRVAERLHAENQRAIAQARAEGAASVERELNAAKRALQTLWATADPSDDDGLELPWYVVAHRALKQTQADAARERAAWTSELAAKDARILALRQRKAKLREAANVLRFEKETAVREMSVLTQTLSTKREHDVEELRTECERRVEQAKHAHGTERMKADQEHKITIDRLRNTLDVERRSYSALKNQSTSYQLEAEKSVEELKDKIARLEKEMDEIRDAAVRWKRKAKLAVKSTTSSVGAHTPTRALFLQSASSHGTDDSDASFRMVFPPPLTPRTPLALRTPRTPRTPRRPSSAIADLSSLMEETLDSLQKDSIDARSVPGSGQPVT